MIGLLSTTKNAPRSSAGEANAQPKGKATWSESHNDPFHAMNGPAPTLLKDKDLLTGITRKTGTVGIKIDTKLTPKTLKQ
jgi:hypothetical protein